jgi:hypothetical protein
MGLTVYAMAASDRSVRTREIWTQYICDPIRTHGWNTSGPNHRRLKQKLPHLGRRAELRRADLTERCSGRFLPAGSHPAEGSHALTPVYMEQSSADNRVSTLP